MSVASGTERNMESHVNAGPGTEGSMDAHLSVDSGTERNMESHVSTGPEMDWTLLRRFHDRLYRDYQDTLSGDRPVLFKMKELWCYELGLFPNSEKIGKKLKKAQKCSEYEQAVDELFRLVL